MGIASFFSNNRSDEEYSQAITRLIVVASVICLISIWSIFQEMSTLPIHIAISYWLFAYSWFLVIKQWPGDYSIRHYISVIGDLGVTSVAVYLIDGLGAALYPFYLWIIVGYGMRYGQKMLIIAMSVGLVSFSTVLTIDDYWQNNLAVGFGLLSGMLILPLFCLVLIRRLHKLNQRLVNELEKSNVAATHDAMTGLVNRSYFLQRLQDEIHHCQRYKEKFSLIYIDLDNFKIINDTHGHQYGDQVLIETSNRLQHFIRRSDTAARLGGDEFALLLPTLHRPSDINGFANQPLDQNIGTTDFY